MISAARERVSLVLTRLEGPLKLHDAQLVIAREHGLPSWPKLVQELDLRRPRRRVQHENGKVWLEGVPRLRWGASAEPTYVGALEAAFRGSERPLDLLDLMGDSGLCFRLRWAVRERARRGAVRPVRRVAGGSRRAQRCDRLRLRVERSRIPPADTRARVKASLEQGYPVLAMPSHMDLGVILGYEDEGATLLVSDYWASDYPERRAITEMQQIGCFLIASRNRAGANRAARSGLGLAVSRFREGWSNPIRAPARATTTAALGFERWVADLERVPQLSAEQLPNLFHVSSWTFSALHQGRTNTPPHTCAARGSVTSVLLVQRPAGGGLSSTTASEALPRCLGRERPDLRHAETATASDSGPADVRRREIELLRDVYELEERAMQPSSARWRATGGFGPPPQQALR